MVWLCIGCLDQLRTIARDRIFLQLKTSQHDVIAWYKGDREEIFEQIVEDMTDRIYNDLDCYADAYFSDEYTDWMHQIDTRLDEWEAERKKEKGDNE